MFEIRHLLVIDAPVGDVFNALTQQQGLAGWWTAQTRIAKGEETIITFGFGVRYHNEMRVRSCNLNPASHLSVEWGHDTSRLVCVACSSGGYSADRRARIRPPAGSRGLQPAAGAWQYCRVGDRLSGAGRGLV